MLNFISIYGQNSFIDYTGTYDCKLTECYPDYHPPTGPSLYCYKSSSYLIIDTLYNDSTFTINTKDQKLFCKLNFDYSFNCGFAFGQFYIPDSIWLFIPLGSAFGGGWSYYGGKSVNNQINEMSLNEVEIFPNPFDNTVNIKCNNDFINNFSLIDLYGNYIIINKILNNSSIDLSFLKSGIYFIKIEYMNEITLFKKVIKK